MAALIIAGSIEEAQPTYEMVGRHQVPAALLTNYSALRLGRIDHDKDYEAWVFGVEFGKFDHFVFLDFPSYQSDLGVGDAGWQFGKAELDAALSALLIAVQRPVANLGLVTKFGGWRPQQSYIHHLFEQLGWRVPVRKIKIVDGLDVREPTIASDHSERIETAAWASILVTPQEHFVMPILGMVFAKSFGIDEAIRATQRMLRQQRLASAWVHLGFSRDAYVVSHVDLCSPAFTDMPPRVEIALMQSFLS